MAKQYGLLLQDKGKIVRPSIFNEDSDSNDDEDKPTGITALKKKDRMAQAKVVAEDPTIYQYDELYDDMQSKRKESKLARKDLDRKPKYINKLLESAERRKRENERRIERQVQTEREAEGDMYKDKESFVTSAYRKKLEEFKELEEKEKREEYLESIGDVKKQGDLSGFYRHLYAQQVNYDETKSDEEKKKKMVENPQPLDEETIKTEEPSKIKRKLPENKNRKYRKHEDSKSIENDSDNETKIKLEHLPSNIDADSDFSIDSDSDSESESKKPKTDDKSSEKNQIISEKSESLEIKPNLDDLETKLDVKNDENTDVNDKKEVVTVEDKPEVPKKPKIDIWKKRTIGLVFDEALMRFYERKSARTIDVL